MQVLDSCFLAAGSGASSWRAFESLGSVRRRPSAPKKAGRRLYLSVHVKFCIAIIFSLGWGSGAIWMATRWFADLSTLIGPVAAALIIFGIAVIPGFMNAFLVVSLLLDWRPKVHANLARLPDITILVAAYNEEKSIAGTLHSLARQDYPGRFRVIVIDDGSTDGTLATVMRFGDRPWLSVIALLRNGGKAQALNEGLKQVDTPLTLTVDGDSWLYKDALRNLVARYVSDPPNTRAVAGAVLVRNSRDTLATRVQEWDYFHGIAAIKRLQSLYQGTLVAQGAFSAYDTAVLRSVGGWPATVGEDIVLTWSFLKAGWRIGFAENACLFTNAPDTWRQFARQRQRWSRGLIEAFKSNWQLLFKPRMTTLFIWWNLFFPYMDLVFTLAFIPGLLLACFGFYWIAGPMTLLVLPLGILVNYLMFSIQSRMFAEQGLRVRKNVLGFVLYSVFYSVILQPACVVGYAQELLNRAKRWNTK
ncbi:MAG: glycosyltransferase family 2 protein [Zoogloeaceae bacterium]|jgi:biofilm PGA synthesis N-glycosyltransferase PgaC|nr:glycosyltransferase family 2 protein [Zoogloeaceae bacterium]